MTRNEHITEEAANALMEKNTTKLEETGRDESPCKDVAHQDGSDSGVEMPTRYRYHHRGHQAEGDAEPDSHTDGRQLTPGDGESNGESSLISYDGASENGSESSSIDDTKKNRPNCINIEKVYCAKTNCCRPALSNRSKFASFANESARCRQSTKCDSPTDARRTMRSSSGTRTRTAVSPDAPGGKATVTCGKSKALPYSLSDAKVTSTFETYATLPRRKQKENADSRSPREPSLNRAASLRKKFLENSLMTTSYNSSLSPTASSQAKTMPPYVKARTKTKIYHEISTQTILTNTDVDRAIADSPFKIFNERTVVTQNDVDNKSDKRAEDQELLKKLRKENSKQRTVIEWLEGELSAAKEEKLRLQNRLVAVEQRIYNLLMHKVTSEDVLLQLEREVSSSNSVISKQQKEITELQQLCCIMQKDLDSIHFAQKASEMESLELQEFLQAEKSTLSDSLKDIEAELDACKKRTRQLEEELTNKKNECASLNTVSEQLKLENQTMKSRLATLERRCKELLVHQGAVTSSASVALSGVGSRFEQLLEQLMNTYEISDADLKDDIYQNDAFTNGYKVANDANTSSAPVWLKVISNILSKTSAAKQDCTDTAECAKNKPPSNCSACKSSNEDTKVSSNLTTSDDSFGLSKLPCDEGDSRRNSILSDVYATDDNLTLDFGISESLTDISESVLMRKNLDRFNAESFNHDVSLVEQVLEIDNLVSKVFKAILFIELDGKKTTVSG